MKILFITYSFPPIGGGGVPRSLKFIKYLPKSGIEPIVLCCDPETSRFPLDHSRLVDVKKNLKIHYAKDILDYPKWMKDHRLKIIYDSLLKFPDEGVNWAKDAIKIGKEIIESESINLIFSSAPFISAHLVGMTLKKEYSLPWIADFRDAWSSVEGETYFLTPYHLYKAKRYKKELLVNADHIIHINNWYINKLKALYPKLIDNKYSLLPNGYDESDYKDYTNLKVRDKDKLVITYSGTINRWRTLKYFIKAVKTYTLKNDISDIKINIYTGRESASKILITKYAGNKNKLFNVYGLIGFKDLLDIWKNSDILLLLIKNKGGLGVHTGKLFEYLRAKKIILALVPNKGEAAKILRESNHNHICDINDERMIIRELDIIYHNWKNNKVIEDIKVNSIYSRENLSIRLGKIIRSIIE